MNELERLRNEKDDFFRSDRQSPLTPEQKKEFSGLKYFPENPSLQLELTLERSGTHEIVALATSTGDEREFEHSGQIRFNVDGQEAVLQVYEADYGFFLPFSDATAPAETYGAGRYLEPEQISPNVLRVDFNAAYNPYCAYNERWSCPLPPNANRLKVRIEAGEKKFHE
jgi:uncharacterized protein (DUF1684 family)